MYEIREYRTDFRHRLCSHLMLRMQRTRNIPMYAMNICCYQLLILRRREAGAMAHKGCLGWHTLQTAFRQFCLVHIIQYTVIHNFTVKIFRRLVSAWNKPSSGLFFLKTFSGRLLLRIGIGSHPLQDVW